jgi:hypothetical protein
MKTKQKIMELVDKFGYLCVTRGWDTIPAQEIRAAIEAALPDVPEHCDPSCTVYSLAEMVMSDCGHSTNNQRLLDRIAERIEKYCESRTATALPDGWKVVPVVMTDEMLRSSCASEFPALFKQALRGENDGEKTTEMIDAIIRRHVKSYKAALSASPKVK